MSSSPKIRPVPLSITDPEEYAFLQDLAMRQYVPNMLHGDVIITGSLSVDAISINELSELTDDAGIIVAGVLRDANSKFQIDLESAQLSVFDNQSTPVARIELGKLGLNPQDYGINIYDSSGSLILGATGLGVNVVDSAQILDGAVTNAKVTSLDAAKVTTGFLDAARIEAGTISTSKLAVGGAGAALNRDPGLTDRLAWTAASPVSAVTIADGKVGTSALRYSGNNYVDLFSVDSTPIDPARTYRLSVWARQTAGAGTNYLTAAFYNSSGGVVTAPGTGWSVGSYLYWGVAGSAFAGSWTRYEFTFGPEGTGTTPTNAATLRLGFLLNYSSGAGTQIDIQDYRLEEVVPGVLIQDGAITAAKMVAGTITAASGIIADAAITNAKIDSLDGGKINTGTLNANRIVASSISSTELGDDSVIDAKISGTSNFAKQVAKSNATRISGGGTMSWSSTGGGQFTWGTRFISIPDPHSSSGYFDFGPVAGVVIPAWNGLWYRRVIGSDYTADNHALDGSGAGYFVQAYTAPYTPPDPTSGFVDYLIAMHNGDNSCLYLHDGRIIPMGGTITGGLFIPNAHITNALIEDATIQSAKIAALDAAKITTGTLDANRISAVNLTAVQANIPDLSTLRADIGTITAGKLQNAGGTRYLDLDASGSDPFLLHEAFSLNADGSAEFAGTISAGALVLEGVKGTMVHDHSNVTGASTTNFAETDLMSRTLPTFQDGDMADLVLVGTTAAGGATKTVRLRLGGVLIATLTIATSGEAWALRGHLIRDGSTTWVIVIPRGGTAATFSTVVSAAVDLSGSILKVTGSTANAAQPVTAEAFVVTSTNKGA